MGYAEQVAAIDQNIANQRQAKAAYLAQKEARAAQAAKTGEMVDQGRDDQLGSFDSAISSMEAQKASLPKPPAAPEIDTRAKDALMRQKEEADKFRASIPEQSNFLTNQYERQARKQLAQDLTGIKRGYNLRGMLYSGQRQGDEAKTQAQAATDYNLMSQKINKGLIDQANAIESGTLNAGYNLAGLGNNQASYDQNQYANQVADEIARMRSSDSAYGALGGALGQVGGAAIQRYTRNQNGYPDALKGFYNV